MTKRKNLTETISLVISQQLRLRNEFRLKKRLMTDMSRSKKRRRDSPSKKNMKGMITDLRNPSMSTTKMTSTMKKNTRLRNTDRKRTLTDLSNLITKRKENFPTLNHLQRLWGRRSRFITDL